jgi:hypothetical protein
MNFKISGLPIVHFEALLRLDDDALRAHGAHRLVVDVADAYPCRITLEDAAPGEEVLLLTHAHQRDPSPYAASGPIFIRRKAATTAVFRNQVPDQQQRRLLSVRAYDQRDWIIDAEVTLGSELGSLIARLFENRAVTYLHVHNARYGCYACRVDRA